jgi:hydroxyacylglutathione hydrolase
VAKVAELRAAGLSSVPSRLAEEKATNPFLRCDQPAVIEAAQAHAESNVVQAAVDRKKALIFAAIRGWRNNF